MARMLAALLLATLAAAPAAVFAADEPDCPTLDIAQIKQLLATAPTCRESYTLLTACAAGGSSDAPLAAIVTERCEALFLDKLSPPRRRAYRSRHTRCDRRYANRQGTMYLSLNVICYAEAARDFAARHGPDTERPPKGK